VALPSRAEVSFDAWRVTLHPARLRGAIKGLPPGGVPLRYIEDRAAPKMTKQGAKGVRLPRKRNKTIAEYTYNGAGQRIKKVVSGVTRVFHYDLRGHMIAESDGAGQTIAEYVYLGDNLLSMIRQGNTHYFHNNNLGTPQVLTDVSGNVVWKALYNPFGMAQITVQTVENPFRLPGQYYDSETGLHYNYFRYYHPKIGRYLTPDPIGLQGGINLWTYVAGNPVNGVDPKGLFFIPPQVIVGGLIGAASGGMGAYLRGGDGVAIGAAVVWGGITGGAAGLVGPVGPLIKGAVGLLGNLWGQGLSNWRQGRPLHCINVGMAVGAFAGSVVGGAMSNWASGAIKSLATSNGGSLLGSLGSQALPGLVGGMAGLAPIVLGPSIGGAIGTWPTGGPY
jgi:RHS repeat-associated protein